MVGVVTMLNIIACTGWKSFRVPLASRDREGNHLASRSPVQEILHPQMNRSWITTERRPLLVEMLWIPSYVVSLIIDR